MMDQSLTVQRAVLCSFEKLFTRAVQRGNA